jgi:hypothetical protein
MNDFVIKGEVKSLKKNFELHQVAMANFVDLNEINKKSGSLLWDIRSTQRAKIA